VLKEGQELGERLGLRRVTTCRWRPRSAVVSRAQGRHEEARLVATRFDFHELPARSGRSTLIPTGLARSLAFLAQAIAGESWSGRWMLRSI